MNRAREIRQNGDTAPPRPPARNRATVNADDLRESLQPGIGHTVLQDRDQHDDGGDIDPASEEAHRRRRLSAPAAVDRATEAEALIVLGTETTPQVLGPTTRLARISGRMQATAALLAAFGPAGIGKIAIDGE